MDEKIWAEATIINNYLIDRIIFEKGKGTEWEYIQFLQQELDHLELWKKEKNQEDILKKEESNEHNQSN